MPYASADKLPSEITDAIPSSEGQNLFRRVFNSAHSSYDGDESKSMSVAWAALRRAGYCKGEDGKWSKQGDALDAKINRIIDMMEGKRKFNFSAKMQIAQQDQRLVSGWASVIEENGEPVIDHQGDVIPLPTLVKAAHQFMSNARPAKAMHQGDPIGEIVESVVFTPDMQKALGIDLKKIGWYITMKIYDDKVWEDVKSGKLKAFSIGGYCSIESTEEDTNNE